MELFFYYGFIHKLGNLRNRKDEMKLAAKYLLNHNLCIRDKNRIIMNELASQEYLSKVKERYKALNKNEMV